MAILFDVYEQTTRIMGHSVVFDAPYFPKNPNGTSSHSVHIRSIDGVNVARNNSSAHPDWGVVLHALHKMCKEARDQGGSDPHAVRRALIRLASN